MLCTEPYQILEWLSQDKSSVDSFMDNIEDVAIIKNHDYRGLSQTEKEETASLLIAALDDPTEWLININDLDSFIRSLAKYKLTHKKEYLDKALEIFDKNLVEHFSEHLDNFISAKWHEHLQASSILKLRRG